MNLRVGLTAGSSLWEQILRQEGIPFAEADLESGKMKEQCSVLIVTRRLDRGQADKVEQYLRAGGAVLGFAGHFQRMEGFTLHREEIAYIVGDHDDVFTDLQLLDVGRVCMIPREANRCKTDQNTFAIFAGDWKGGYAVFLPLDPAEQLTDERTANKNFYARTERLPSEDVSLAGKGELRQLLHRSLEYLFHALGLPYVHLWYFPDGRKNIFMLRIDSDGASQHDVDELYRVARDHAAGMSWFLDVKSHESWLSHFRTMVGQELGLHCYEHLVYPGYEANLENIRNASHIMEREGLKPAGFAAPYGQWNPALAKAIDSVGFEYSSEFGFAYDSLPFYPEFHETRYRTLQVPIHPICIGNMVKIGYSPARMKEYFSMVADQKLARAEPLFFYHHPSHRNLDVVDELFSHAEENEIGSTTLGAFARWWKSRLECSFTSICEEDKLNCKLSCPDGHAEGIWMRVSSSGRREALLPITPEVRLKEVPWVERSDWPPPADLRRIREFDPRRVLGDIYTRFVRRFR